MMVGDAVTRCEDEMARHFEIETVEVNGMAVLVATAVQSSILGGIGLERCARELAGIDPAARIVLDLSAIEHAGSTFLASLIQLHLATRDHGGRLCLCGATPSLRFALSASRLERLFQLAERREAPLAVVTEG